MGRDVRFADKNEVEDEDTSEEEENEESDHGEPVDPISGDDEVSDL